VRNVGSSRAEFSPYIQKKKNPDNNSSDKSKAFELTSRLFNPESRTHSLKWSASCRKEAPTYSRLGSHCGSKISRYEMGGGARRNHATWSKNKSAVSALRRGPHQLRLLLHDIFISYLDPSSIAVPFEWHIYKLSRPTNCSSFLHQILRYCACSKKNNYFLNYYYYYLLFYFLFFKIYINVPFDYRSVVGNNSLTKYYYLVLVFTIQKREKLTKLCF
jgi:hypothetical protein